MTTRRIAPWIKDALGLHVEPGYIIAAGLPGTVKMAHMVVQGIYLDRYDGIPYGTARVDSKEIIFKHLDDTFYTQDSYGLVTCPLITIKGKLINSDKTIKGTKTFNVNSVTRSGDKLNNFVRIAEDIDEFKESLIFL